MSLYIHIPFCRQACTYCDFHFSTSRKMENEMVEAIRAEIRMRNTYLSGEPLSTVYFGSGTPSLLPPEAIRSIIETAGIELVIQPGAEVTLEANPDDITADLCREWLAAGVNRLSIGIQSFSDEDLRFMNRSHNAAQALEAIQTARKSGFRNISIDLIYGIPGQQPEQWQKNLDLAFALRPEHLSCYALTVEARTALADLIRKRKSPPPADEKSAADFGMLMERAQKEGYEHYEISNFARDKMYSQHNTSYWRKRKYLGAGPSAHSYDFTSRQWNIANNPQYIREISRGNLPFEREVLTEINKFNERVLTSLRTMWGISMAEIKSDFGKETALILEKSIEPFISKGQVERAGDVFRLTSTGKYYADAIAAALFL